MQRSITQTLSVPIIGTTTPTRLAQAGDAPTRVLVRNTGGNQILIAHDIAMLSDINSLGQVYQLPPAAADVFVLSPGQPMFAAAVGAGGQVSVAISESYPVHRVES